jgi:uridine kinase
MTRYKSYLVGISGGSASGKTWLLNALTSFFKTTDLSLVSQDNYYQPAEKQKVDGNGVINFDLPESVDLNQLEKDLSSLKSGKPIYIQEYLFQLDRAQAKTITINPAPIILVEGLFIFHHQPLFQALDLRVFVEAEESLKYQRRLERDTQERGVNAEMVAYQWENHVNPAYKKYLEPYKAKADLVLNNNTTDFRALEVMRNHLQQILTQHEL